MAASAARFSSTSISSISTQILLANRHVPENEKLLRPKSPFQEGGAVLQGRTTMENFDSGAGVGIGSETYEGALLDLQQIRETQPTPFTQRFTQRQEAALEARLRELQCVADNAALIAADLKTNPYGTERFFDGDVEPVVLYALREGILTEFEAANILLFKVACDTYGRENVKVHFLRDKEGEIDTVEWGRFIASAAPLLSGVAAKTNPSLRFLTVLELTPALREVSLPRHQLVFFSMPEDEVVTSTRQKLWSSGNAFMQVTVEGEKRRMIMTPQLLQEHFYKLLPKRDEPRAHLVFRSSSFGRDFCEREVFIPSFLSSTPRKEALDFYDKDLYWLTADLCNPHLGALQELWEEVQKTPYANSIQKWSYQHPRDRYQKHNCLVYREAFSKEGLKAPLQRLFWETLVDLLAEYTEWFDFEWEVSGLKVEFRSLIAYIGENRERWEREYGITLESLAQSDFKVTHRTKFATEALRELASEYLEEQRFSDTRKKVRNVTRGFINGLVYFFAEQTGGD